MQIEERYKLFFVWTGIKFSKEIAKFKEAWFEGPVLKNALRLMPEDFIDLDFTRQNITTNLFIPKDFYVTRLRWKGIEYKDDKIFLSKCTLSNNRAGTLKNLKDGFKVLVDCSRHESYAHSNNLVYQSWVLNPEDLIK